MMTALVVNYIHIYMYFPKGQCMFINILVTIIITRINRIRNPIAAYVLSMSVERHLTVSFTCKYYESDHMMYDVKLNKKLSFKLISFNASP